MGDITKARFYLKTRQSKLQHLQSFGLMLATIEREYRDTRLKISSNKEAEGLLDEKLIEVGLDLAVLRYLKKRAQLPPNIGEVFRGDTTLEDKLRLSKEWVAA